MPIGKYGNGFKTGSMRLGKSALVFTKDNLYQSVGFLSQVIQPRRKAIMAIPTIQQTYLDDIDAPEVLVPMCSWSLAPPHETGQDVAPYQHYSSCLMHEGM